VEKQMERHMDNLKTQCLCNPWWRHYERNYNVEPCSRGNQTVPYVDFIHKFLTNSIHIWRQHMPNI